MISKKIGTTFNEISDVFIKKSSEWKTVSEAYLKVDGLWKLIYQDTTITANDDISNCYLTQSVTVLFNQLIANDTEEDNAIIQVTGILSPDIGSIVVNETNLTYTATEGVSGTVVTVFYEVSLVDDPSNKTTGKLLITLNELPVIHTTTLNKSLYKGHFTTISNSELTPLISDDGSTIEGNITYISGFTNSIGGNVELAGGVYTFTSDGTDTASFDVQISNSIGASAILPIIFNIEPKPSVIVNNSFYSTPPNTELMLTKDDLGFNIDTSNKFEITNLTTSSDYITITDMGSYYKIITVNEIGKTDLLTLTVTDEYNSIATGDLSIGVTNYNEIDSLIFIPTNGETIDDLLSTSTPPTMEDIFATWPVTEGNNYYENVSVASGNAASWYYDSGLNSVVQPVNSDPVCSFVSPIGYDRFNFQAYVMSDSNDDDALGLIIAHTFEDGVNHFLTLGVSGHGAVPSNGCSLMYFNGNFSSRVSFDEYDGISPLYLKGAGVVIRVERNYNNITCYVGTDWNEHQINPGTKMEVDLNNHPELSRFLGPRSYGFQTQSQADSYYQEVVFEGGVDLTTIIDFNTGIVYNYNDSTITWDQSNETINETLGYPRTTINPETGHRFLILQNSIEHLGVEVDSTQYSASKLLLNNQNVSYKAPKTLINVTTSDKITHLLLNDNMQTNIVLNKLIIEDITVNSDTNTLKILKTNFNNDLSINSVYIPGFLGGYLMTDSFKAYDIISVSDDDTYVYINVKSREFKIYDITN